MANTPEMVKLAIELKPDFVCLVPEKREEISTEGGLDVIGHLNSLRSTVEQLQEAGIRVSLFIDPDEAQIAAAAEIGAEMIELHTGCYANCLNEDERKIEIHRLFTASQFGLEKGLQVNAGHGLNSQNLKEFLHVKNLTELNIGHHLVSRALTVGLEQAVREMKEQMESYDKGS
nr:pyridoxine 5'-phosphate synthase-like [Nerophis lumbriciformis]